MTAPSVTAASAPAASPVPSGWRLRLDDPVSRFFRYPVAGLLARALRGTSIRPNQLTLVGPVLASTAGWLLASDATWKMALAVALFELRAILDCADGALARAKGEVTPWGHAIDGVADWLCYAFLCAGIFWHFHLHPPAAGSWSAYVSPGGILFLAALQGALRTLAAAHYRRKYVGIFERGSDPTRGPDEVSDEHVKELQRNEQSLSTKLIAMSWSFSNGHSFVTLVCLSILAGKLWEGQLFFASFGSLWIGAVILANGLFVRSASRRAKLAVSAAE